MKKSSAFALAVIALFSISCKGKKELANKSASSLPKLNIFNSPLDQLLSYKQPIELYTFKYGRFTLESQSTLHVRKNDTLKEFNGFSKLEMDKRGSFKLTRKAFFQDAPTEVMVVGSEALYRDHPKKDFKKLFPDPEFLNWARAAVAEIFSTYDQTDFTDSAQIASDGSSDYKCYKNVSGSLCLDKSTLLPLTGKYRVDVSGDKAAVENTTLDIEFKIVPHPQSSELLLLPEK